MLGVFADIITKFCKIKHIHGRTDYGQPTFLYDAYSGNRKNCLIYRCSHSPAFERTWTDLSQPQFFCLIHFSKIRNVEKYESEIHHKHVRADFICPCGTADYKAQRTKSSNNWAKLPRKHVDRRTGSKHRKI